MEVDLFVFTYTIFGIFIAFCLFTQLYGKGNPLESWAAFSYLATGTAMSIMWAWSYIKSNAILGLQQGQWFFVPAIILGFMMWFRVHPKYSYISRLPIAFTMGLSLGWGLRTGIFTSFIIPIRATITKLWIPEYGATYLLARTTIAVCVITMMSFFIYTTEIKGPHLWSATIGEYAMYIAFGAAVAQTFMGRLGLFVGHMQDIMFPLWKQPYTLGSAIIVFVLMMILEKTGWGPKLAAS